MSRFRTSYIVGKLKNQDSETFESQVVIHNQKCRYYKKNELYMLNGTPKLKSHFVRHKMRNLRTNCSKKEKKLDIKSKRIYEGSNSYTQYTRWTVSNPP